MGPRLGATIGPTSLPMGVAQVGLPVANWSWASLDETYLGPIANLKWAPDGLPM